MESLIFKSLEKLNLTSLKTRKLYNSRTRDMDSIEVWKDEVSGVIYIDSFYTGNKTYIDGDYRTDSNLELKSGKPDFENSIDTNRRIKANLKFVAGKNIADFGCGNGDFLKNVKPYCESVLGIELQKSFVDSLNQNGIDCVSELSEIENSSLETIVSFHVIEHLPDPLTTLQKLKSKLRSNGKIIIEVPHAKDFLLSGLSNENFKQFTLWSQHLILHTRESLYNFLKFAGFKNIVISGIQRYPLSNHLNWIVNGMAAGHKSILSTIDTYNLNIEYQNALSKIDATDTLIAIASSD